ncbi:SERTA domain-containing protein 2b [Cyclopterus lumpus]|uniref:SERTA domain containing 2b n=1 Tax=Cyclopterus lumpus TaxID=8103 RepID=A0A8C2WS79_CYCLU|nr:SERTA domain-containing protein 2b [Cyclopterus lumpus]XP_034407175.1 SERTA domain-containing protein 2b [Cyclopterus lumpus]XP_034407176.1 SERTA domain-containing protein 2b [Cyclopterus lumpus]XP_034407177.1 SERTA domain-containing protein 2b [Cyclopterus lumpus]XP_034407178.1 SERTA domain-containing protein 2b [Cyclopterus lumpus]XP_034407179.1 SERTA domain-containing protein 2b [Cyclopterus lumpus]
MFGKGAKRKLDEDEEGLEGKTLEAPVAGGGLGLVPEGLSKVSYTLQRQTIFNISLMKLYSQRPLGEPSLERRVLINNMLRRIQDELKQEGSLRPLLLPPSPPPDDPMDEGFREAAPSFGVLSAQASQASVLLMPAIVPPLSPHPMVPPNCQTSQASPDCSEAFPAPLESCLTPASLLEEDGGDSAFCTLSPPTPPLSPPPAQPPPLPSALLSLASPRVPAPALSSDGFPSALSDMELGPPTAITRTAAANSTTVTTSPAPTPLTQPSQQASLSPSPAGPLRDCRTMGAKSAAVGVLLAEARCTELRPMDPLPTLPPGGLVDISSSSSSSPSGFLSDLALDDVLFADIDTSMYDFDPCTTAGAVGAAGGGLTKLPPAVTADDLLKSLASPYSGPAPQVSANQPFKIDLTELDHIMEVLVGS